MVLPLRTERLTLSVLTAADRTAFVRYRRDPDVARWQSWSTTYSDDDADALLADQPAGIEAGSGRWVQIAIHDAGGTLQGDVAVRALSDQPDSYEIGVTLAPAAQGRGIASEALAALTEALFTELGAHRVFAVSDARNENVARLMRRSGFRHEGRNVDADWFKNEWTSLDTWAMLRRDR
ncbi:GNAT family N-acetyltransferase [Microbacterium aurantiacum]|uniref:GNAT family N-acetyltransferase n=1 Tax=Microbacterium aurantiacum TaxID=162393 RepID=A0ABT8FSP1_9MICO|nr:GNAT family protein [Microbacterium aurantiacum]MDN4464324.1 GNAT family N-acetyltransferase [Microbacterium aurantiacum]